MSNVRSIDHFVTKAHVKHGDKYDYSLVEYKSVISVVKIICPVHGVFEQTPSNHYTGGCAKCKGDQCSVRKRSFSDKFITGARNTHGNKYDYSLIDYVNNRTKIKIICPVHGVFEQTPSNHLKGQCCPKCKGVYRLGYASQGIPVYDIYFFKLEQYNIICRRSPKNEDILETKCFYCNKWYIPSINSVWRRLQTIKGTGNRRGELHLYCSEGCKYSCSTYGQKLYPKGFKPATSREVQPQLRKLVLERDNWTCQKCGSTDELHCHHIDPVVNNPIESADVDNCITYCVECHKEAHQQDGCGYNELKNCY